MTRTGQRNPPRSASFDLCADIAALCPSHLQNRTAIDHAIIGGVGRLVNDFPDEIRALVIRGDGDHFCAGADLVSIADNNASDPGDGLDLAKHAVVNTPSPRFAAMQALPCAGRTVSATDFLPAGLMFWGI